MIWHSSEYNEKGHEQSVKAASNPGKILTGDLLSTSQE